MIWVTLAFLFNLHATAGQDDHPSSQYGSWPQAYSPLNTSMTDSAEARCLDTNWDSECMCNQQGQKIAWIKAQGKDINEFDWSPVQSKKLVIIGDAHTVTHPKAILDLMRLSRSEAGKQCVFFEISSNFSAEHLFSLLKEKSGLDETDRLRRYYDKILNGALALGLKPYLVDDPRNWEGDLPVTDLEREIHMALTVQNLFKSQDCDHAIFLVGKAHVAEKYYGQDNLTEQLAKAGISLTTLNPIHAPNGGRNNGPIEEWNGICLSQTFTPPKAMIFPNSGVKNTLISPGFTIPSSTMTYGSFEYSILFPEPHFESF